MADPVFTYDLASTEAGVRDRSTVRLLLNDVDQASVVFGDDELDAFLTLEGGVVKLAAAQAIDTNATDQALAMKVLRDREVTTDGAKLADAMRKHAESLRAQHRAATVQAADDADEGHFAMVPTVGSGPRGPEGVRRTGWW